MSLISKKYHKLYLETSNKDKTLEANLPERYVRKALETPARWIVQFFAVCEDETGQFIETWTVSPRAQVVFKDSTTLDSMRTLFLESLERYRIIEHGWRATLYSPEKARKWGLTKGVEVIKIEMPSEWSL
jgi:hypothetical protein